jgi:hypothetical protein
MHTKIENTTVRAINLPPLLGQMVLLAPGVNDVRSDYVEAALKLPQVRRMFEPWPGENEAPLRLVGAAPVVASAPALESAGVVGAPARGELSADPEIAREQIRECDNPEQIRVWGMATTDRPEIQAALHKRFAELNH